LASASDHDSEEGAGAYLRRIRLTGTIGPDGGEVLAELEDDFHHFEVRLRHDGRTITGLDPAAIRFPWSTCPQAGARLRPLEGAPLSSRSTGHAAVLSPRSNCTHLFDLAGLAMAHAAAGRTRRQYDVRIPEVTGSRRTATLCRDGEPLLRWEVEGREILDPPPYAGQRLRGAGFIEWAESTLDPDEAEAALVLRRALDIGMGRGMDLDPYPNAAAIAEIVGPVCFTFHPDQAGRAARMKGSTWDFAAHPDRLLSGVEENPAAGSRRDA
jgi:hypothetical protein